VPTFGDNYFVRSRVVAGASFGSSRRQETRKTTPEEFGKKSIIAPTAEAKAKGTKDEKEENVWFFLGIDRARSQRQAM
jgi:hypothetical protein